MGDASSNGGFPIAMLVYQSVHTSLFATLKDHPPLRKMQNSSAQCQAEMSSAERTLKRLLRKWHPAPVVSFLDSWPRFCFVVFFWFSPMFPIDTPLTARVFLRNAAGWGLGWKFCSPFRAPTSGRKRFAGHRKATLVAAKEGPKNMRPR